MQLLDSLKQLRCSGHLPRCYYACKRHWHHTYRTVHGSISNCLCQVCLQPVSSQNHAQQNHIIEQSKLVRHACAVPQYTSKHVHSVTTRIQCYPATPCERIAFGQVGKRFVVAPVGGIRFNFAAHPWGAQHRRKPSCFSRGLRPQSQPTCDHISFHEQDIIMYGPDMLLCGPYIIICRLYMITHGPYMVLYGPYLMICRPSYCFRR